MDSYRETREIMCDICHKMWQLGWVAANDGNLSVRVADDRYLATPTGISKSFITPEKLVVIDGDGKVLEAKGEYRPSSEIKMHLRCYRERSDVGAVLHAHPPTATGYAVAHVPLDRYTMIETVAAIGSIPVTPYGTPSTYEVPDAIAPYLQEHDVLLLANHGALSVGADALTAYYRMETLELFAKISLTAHLLGGEKEISRENIQKLIDLRRYYGITGRHPGYKHYRTEES
ncbi:MAG TPA: class II aldolase/adducin family protein [Candidatus Fimenecus excrementigallinarum]|uniref:Class II aldolase/adducin family protein n=1 Tax=Candidatus Fimenecus excrementigallinarum TaxID=2840816 RepID=A0A9D1IEN1_9FIRM|nr:class II aldolase/adducin family protein [Candidatus Fimenecus excrementigallinarum]